MTLTAGKRDEPFLPKFSGRSTTSELVVKRLSGVYCGILYSLCVTRRKNDTRGRPRGAARFPLAVALTNLLVLVCNTVGSRSLFAFSILSPFLSHLVCAVFLFLESEIRQQVRRFSRPGGVWWLPVLYLHFRNSEVAVWDSALGHRQLTVVRNNSQYSVELNQNVNKQGRGCQFLCSSPPRVSPSWWNGAWCH